jgi:hypothetical protein
LEDEVEVLPGPDLEQAFPPLYLPTPLRTPQRMWFLPSLPHPPVLAAIIKTVG